jgi:hypothetical protein
MLKKNLSCLLSFNLILVLAAGMPSLGRSDVIAEWTFDGVDASFLADSSGNGHNLGNAGVTRGTTTVTGTGGSAYFGGAQNGFWTSSVLDLSSYRHLKVTWAQLVQGNSMAMVFEHSADTNANSGGFSVDVNEPAAGSGLASLGPFEAKTLNSVSFAHGSGSSNTTWENMELDINLDAASNTSVLTLTKNGVVAGSYDNYPYTTLNNEGDAPASFGEAYYFNIGCRQGGTLSLTGYIDNLTISSVPEPSAIMLLGTAILGLIAYAWRKRG